MAYLTSLREPTPGCMHVSSASVGSGVALYQPQTTRRAMLTEKLRRWWKRPWNWLNQAPPHCGDLNQAAPPHCGSEPPQCGSESPHCGDGSIQAGEAALDAMGRAWVSCPSGINLRSGSPRDLAIRFRSRMEAEPRLAGMGINSAWIREHYLAFCRAEGVQAPPYKDFARELAAVMRRKRRDKQVGGRRSTASFYSVPDRSSTISELNTLAEEVLPTHLSRQPRADVSTRFHR